MTVDLYDTEDGRLTIQDAFMALGGSPPPEANVDTELYGAVDSTILVRAMAKAGNQLLTAGPERLYNELAVIQDLGDPEAQALLLRL